MMIILTFLDLIRSKMLGTKKFIIKIFETLWVFSHQHSACNSLHK